MHVLMQLAHATAPRLPAILDGLNFSFDPAAPLLMCHISYFVTAVAGLRERDRK